MQSPYSAVITVKSKCMVDVAFLRPLSPETACKLKALKQNGISVVNIPAPLTPGFWFMLDDFWDASETQRIAQSCLDILCEEGFELKRILCKNFVPNVQTYQNSALKTMAVELKLRDDLGKGFAVVGEGANRYRIFTPFQFRNGDHLGIVLKKIDGDWFLTDEGHTYQHLNCRLSLISLDIVMDNPFLVQALAELSVEDRQREMLIKIIDTEYASALYKLIHVLLQVITLAELVASN